MKFLDWMIIGIITILAIITVIYLLKNKGSCSTECRNCKFHNECHKRKKD